MMRRDLGLADYLTHMQLRRLSPRTIAGRICVLRGLAAFAGRPLLRLTAEDLVAWERWLRVTPDTAATYVSAVRAFYAWAERTGRVRRSPAAWLPAPARSRRLPRPVGEAELAAALAGAAPDVRLMIVLAAWLGLRCCEISGLRWEHVSLATRTVLVIGKGRRERLLPLSDFLIGELRAYGLARSGYVLLRRDGQPGPVAAYRVGQLVSRQFRGAGVDATAHRGRHRFATGVLAACHDVRVVQELLGHESLQSTQIYTRWDQPTAVAAVAALPPPECFTITEKAA